MNKRESAFQIAFGKWVKHCWTGGSAAFELKRTLLRSLPLAAIKDHQVLALSQAAGNGHFYKIPDDSIAQKPYDSYVIKGQAYVAVAYGEHLKDFWLFDVQEIIRLKDNGVVSLKESEAAEYGTHHVLQKRRAGG